MIEVDTSPQGQEEREVWRERARPFAEAVADDGKHASSVIEVDISPQGQQEREVWRERSAARDH